MVGWLPGSLFTCLAGLVAWLVCCLNLVGWLEGGGLEVGTLSLLVGLVGWLPVLAGWFGSTRQRLVPSPGALTEGSGRGPGLSLFEKTRKAVSTFHAQLWAEPKGFCMEKAGSWPAFVHTILKKKPSKTARFS